MVGNLLQRKESRMNQKVMLVEKERFLLNDNCKYMITGRVSKEADIECYLDGIRLPSDMQPFF